MSASARERFARRSPWSDRARSGKSPFESPELVLDPSHFFQINCGLLLGAQMRATRELREHVLEVDVDEVRIAVEPA